MPRFHFKMRDGEVDLDGEGTDCSDLQAAKVEAVRYLGECLQDSPADVVRDGRLEVELTDGEGAPLFVARLVCEAVDARAAGAAPPG